MSEELAVKQPGIYAMPMERYLADPCPQPSLSSGIIHAICSESPLHAFTQHPRLNPGAAGEEKEIMDVGTIAHALMLEGVSHAKIISEAVDAKGVLRQIDDWRLSDAKRQRDEARANGKVPILAGKYDAVMRMIRAARQQLNEHKEAHDAFTNGLPEQTIIWQEEGLWCRARPDWLHDSHSIMDDYKTTGATANPEVLSRTLFTNGWDIQAAWYRRGLKAITGKDAQFRFVVQETYAPHALSVMALGPDVLMLAEKKIMFAMDVWRACLEEDRWPGYPTRTCYAELPPYEESRWLEKEIQSI